VLKKCSGELIFLAADWWISLAGNWCLLVTDIWAHGMLYRLQGEYVCLEYAYGRCISKGISYNSDI
jgi:hypothetical protein